MDGWADERKNGKCMDGWMDGREWVWNEGKITDAAELLSLAGQYSTLLSLLNRKLASLVAMTNDDGSEKQQQRNLWRDAAHRFHSISIERFRFCEIPYCELIFYIFEHISNSEVEPLLMTSSICVNIHEQVIFLRGLRSILKNLFYVATLKMTVNEKSC